MSNPKHRILCVDGHADTCALLSLLLGLENYEVTCAATMVEGLRLAQCRVFDLYLLDQRFPDGTGVELCQKLRRFDQDTPVLFFSGLAQECYRQQAMAAGAQGYLIKPNALDTLASTVAQQLIKPDDYAYA